MNLNRRLVGRVLMADAEGLSGIDFSISCKSCGHPNDEIG